MKDSTQLNFHRLILIVGVTLIPIILSSSIYNAIDCTKLSKDGYQLWLKSNPNKSFQDFTDSCNNIHSLPLILFVPLSPVLGFGAWYTTRGSLNDKTSKPSTEESK